MKEVKTNNSGMTFPELILAILMLTAFTGTTVMVTQFTSRFFQTLNEGAKKENISSNKEFNDVINNHLRINKAMDSIIEIFSEPGIDKDFILNLNCTSLPASEWNIPAINSEAIPVSYKICIKPSSLPESNYTELVKGEGKPGIYILYSNPENGISVNAVPVRRIFCRPKPFCKL